MKDTDIGKTIPNQHLRRNRERFSTTHTARDPKKVEEVELDSEELQGMLRQPLKVGAVRFHHEPEGINTSHSIFTTTTSFITPRGPYQLQGASWHLLTKV